MHETLANPPTIFDRPVGGNSLRTLVSDCAGFIVVWTYSHAGEITINFLSNLMGKFFTRYRSTGPSPIQRMDLPLCG